MSEFHVEVVRIGEISKHPNADSLAITMVYDYPAIVRIGDFQPGDLAVYIPVDAVVPQGDPRFEFLAGHRRIRAKRLRGVFSMGLLVPASPGMDVGQDVAEAWGITRWEPTETPDLNGENQPDPGFLPRYTDIEGLRRWPRVLQEGEEVVITEKIHGANARFCWHRDQLWIFSHGKCKVSGGNDLWNRAAVRYDLADRMQAIPDIGLYGEVYGQVQDLKYGAKPGEVYIRLFDAFDLGRGRYFNFDEFLAIADLVGLPVVPILYRGPWDSSLVSLAEGPTTLSRGEHVREGFVVKPVIERYQHSPGRVILKRHGEGYLTRKETKS